MYWQNTKILRYFFAFISIVAIASLIIVVGLGGRNHASALTSAQQHNCYDTWNGKNATVGGTESVDLLKMCVDASYCVEGPLVDGGILSWYPVTCTNPATQEAASAAASQAVVAPLITAVCGVAPPIINQTGVYLTCSNKVVADYNACAMTGGPATSSVVDTSTNTARCFVAKGNKISVAAAKIAIDEGRAAGDAIITKAAEAKMASECAASGKVIVGGKCVAKPADPTPKSTCTIDGIGWIICPVVNFMAGIADSAFGFLADNFLATSPKIFDSANPTFTAWSAMRNIANVAFVIAFLIIIFSQLTSVGITNYGVKKMLPRLVIAAILVNISYFICQIAVDLSNILGYSLKDLLQGLAATATGTTPTTASSWASGGGLAGVAGGILGFGGAVAIGYALLATLIPVVLAALVALIAILFILVARQALIILLIVVSPLAFVAYLLPNTEQWFKKWQKTFTAMLMLFPIIALVFGMSSLAAEILSKNADFGTTSFKATEANTMFAQVIAAAVMVLPLFVVPSLLKKALDGVGGIGAKINGIGGKLGGALGKKGSQGFENSRMGQYKKFRAANFARNRALIQSGKYTGGGVRGLISKGNDKFNKSNYSGKFGDRSAAAGASQVIKEENEEVENAERLIRTEKGPDELLGHAKITFQDAVKSGDTIKARAAQKILLNSGAKGLSLLHESLTQVVQTETNAATIADIKTDINGAGLKGRDNVINTFGHDSRSMGEIENDKNIIGGLTPAELAGQIDSNLEHAERIGAISPAQAQLIIDNPNSAQLLNGPKLAVLHGIIAGRTPPPPAPVSPPATP